MADKKPWYAPAGLFRGTIKEKPPQEKTTMVNYIAPPIPAPGNGGGNYIALPAPGNGGGGGGTYYGGGGGLNGFLTVNTYITTFMPTTVNTVTYALTAGTPIYYSGGGGIAYKFCDRPQVRVEPPRVRTIFLRGEPVRLSFPYVILVEGTTGHSAYVSPEMPTWDSVIYEFPLTFHRKADGAVDGYSHFGLAGHVCYAPNALSQAKIQKADSSVLFWSSNLSKYDPDFVKEWRQKSKEEGRKFAIRNKSSFKTIESAFRTQGGAGYDYVKLLPLKLGVNVPDGVLHQPPWWAPYGYNQGMVEYIFKAWEEKFKLPES